MDTLETYRQIIRSVLTPYAHITSANLNVRNLPAFDFHEPSVRHTGFAIA